MAISYPLTLPATPFPKTTRITPSSAVALSESPLSNAQQAYAWPGQKWQMTVVLPPMKRAKAEAWFSAFLLLNNRFGTFLMGDWDARTPRGIATGTPQANGAGQTGNSFATKGWTAGKTGILLAGDYIQLGTGVVSPPSTARLYKVLQDANSDGSGHATLTIWPNLRESPNDGDAIITSACVGTWRLTGAVPIDTDENSNYGSTDSSSASGSSGITFSAQEAL